MGMFDWVDREPIYCPRCGEIVDTFQTKSGVNKLKTYTEEELIEVADSADCSYYGYCDKCGKMTYFKYIPAHWEVEDGE